MADYEDHAAELREAGIRVAAFSVDDREDARKMREDTGFDFPLLHSLDARGTRERIGCYIKDGEDRTFLHATSFILDPEGTVRLAVYSSGAVGRLEPDDALKTIQHMRDG